MINGFIILLFIGCSYAWSVFVVPLEQAYGWVRAQTSLAFTLNIIFFTTGGMVAGVLAKKMSFATLVRISAVMIGIGFGLTSIVTLPWQVYLTYSFLCGTGIGICYNCVVSVVPSWFPDRTGLVSGVLLMGYAMSTAIFGPALTSLIESAGITATFRILGAGCLGVLCLASFLMKMPSEQERKSLPKSGNAKKANMLDVTPGDMIKMPVFWIELVLIVFLSGVGLTMINHTSPLITEEFHVAATTAALVISCNSVLNGAGRILGGMLFDKKGIGPVMLGIPSLMAVALILLLVSLYTGFFPLCVVGTGLLLLAFGANANMIPTIARALFGDKNFSINFPILNAGSIGAAFVPTMMGVLQATSGGYRLPLQVMLVFSVASLGLAMLMMRLKK